ncbi:hypothetical protein ABZS29_38505 [Kribbella sp. NPDC005582]|uniref:hypothetical protein n=1 Tax=Kribbella sp. NPDC005582 TaxID=3156893 RepID=UPI0033BD5F67
MFKLTRKYSPKGDGWVFVIMPFKQKLVGPEGDQKLFDFDGFYDKILAPTIEAAGLKPRRADGMYGKGGILETISQGIQEADLVLADFSGRNPNVSAELMLSFAFGKRVVLISQRMDDIPIDFQGDRVQKYPGDLNYLDVEEFRRTLVKELVAVQAELPDEMEFAPLKGFAPEDAPGQVLSVDRERAVVQIDGTTDIYLLSGRDVDWNRVVTDLTKKFRVGQPVRGSIVHNPDGGKFYSLLDYSKGNPWISIQEQFEVGSVITNSPVRKVLPGVGAFIKVRDDVNALLPEKEFNGASPQMGDCVDVAITRLDANERKVAVALRGRAKPADVRPIGPMPEVGFATWATVSRIVPEADHKGGFVLLRLPGFPRLAMLHVSRMSTEIRALFSSGNLSEDEELYVRVVEVSPERGKTLLEDVDPPAVEPAVEDVPDVA